MDLLDRLEKDHDALRRRMSGLSDAVSSAGPGTSLVLREPLLPRLRALYNELEAALKAHEAIENRLTAALVEIGSDAAPALKSLEAMHRSIDETMRILSAVSVAGCDRDGYSFKFALSSLSVIIEGHFTFEEQIVFPLLRSRLAAERLEALAVPDS